MRMEREDWSGHILVAQEASALVELLCEQNSSVLERVFALVEPNTMSSIRSQVNNRSIVSATVDYFKTTDHDTCRRFLSTVIDYCENIPFLLETALVSVAGYTSGIPICHTSDTDRFSPSRNLKRPRLDYLQSYTDSLKSMIQQKHETVRHGVVKEIRLDDTWVFLKHRNPLRAKDRSIQASLDNHDREESENKVSVESLLKTTGRVVVLLGQAGSGKTLLVHCLGSSWTEGSFPSIHLLFLLEFRQLNLISRSLSLKDLLFLFYPVCEDEEEQSKVVFEFILSNPEKVCFIFDGYDEFRAKLTNPGKLESTIDPTKPLPMTDLISGLCNRRILPDCTVLVTCRPRDVTDMFESPGFVTCDLQGFDRLGVKNYAEQYFSKKGDEFKMKAVNLLMDNRHLLSMSQVPGLCHICCVCVEHLFSSKGTNLQLPTSLTQIYMQILMAFLRSYNGGEISHTPPLQRYRTEIVKLSQLALKGLDQSTIVFMDTEVPQELQEFGIKSGILSRVKLTCEDGSSQHGFTFMHLTMQEFLAALHLMTSQNITERHLKQRINLKTRWITKIDPKSVFTDSLHLYTCGLAAKACTSSLIQLQEAQGMTTWVQKRQAFVRNILLELGSSSQTGPKIVELCRCAQETQDGKLARAIGSRPQFELRNIRLYAVDMESLAYVTTAADQPVCLDFGGCTIDQDCLEILPSFKNVDHLIFRSRKYDDKFADALSGILSKLQALRRLDFISGGLTDIGAAKLASALEDCPQISHINVSDNSLKDEGIMEIAETLSRLPNISVVLMGKNCISIDGVLTLTERMAVCSSVQEVLVDADEEISLSFSQSSETHCENMNNTEGVIIRLKQINITCNHIDSLCSKLKGFSFITVLDLSNNSLGNKGVKKILDFLPKLGMIQEINVSENGVDMDGVVILASALCNHKNLKRVDASENAKQHLVLWFDDIRRYTSKQLTSSDTAVHKLKKLRLTQSDIQPVYMTKLCNQLVKCKSPLDIEFSHLKLSNESVGKLKLFLPEMSFLNLLNLSHVDLSTNGALLLVRSLADCQRVVAVELRYQAEAFIKFVPEKAEKAICKLAKYSLSKTNVEELSSILEKCPHLSEVDLSYNLLQDEGVRCFVDHLPKLKISSSVILRGNQISPVGALHLVNSMNTCEKVVAIDVSLGVEDQSLIQFVQEHVNGKTLRLRDCRFEVVHLKNLVEILNQCTRLITLELSDSNLMESHSLYILLESLARLSTIQNVKLKNNGLISDHIEHFVKQFSIGEQHRDIRIEEPWLTRNALISVIVNCLNQQPHIKEIRVGCGSLNIITESNSIPNSSFRAQPENVSSALQAISFDDCGIEGQHLTPLILPIQKCHALQDLSFSQLKVDKESTEFFSAVIPSLLNLRNLTLDLKGAAEDEVESLAQALPNNPAFESLSLSQLVLGDCGAAMFGTALQRVPNLKSFNLSQCSGWSAARGRVLVQGLVQCVSLVEIRLDSVILDEEGVTILAQGFSCLTSIRRLSLNNMRVVTSETFVNGTGILALLNSFKSFTQMEEIELDNWKMGDRGVYELVKHIASWTELLKLSLSDNNVTDQGGETLLMALSNCRALQKLQLSKNQLGPNSAAKLAQVLLVLPHLSELSLSENQFGPQGSMVLCEGLMSMKALKILHLTSIGSSDLVGVASSLKHCPSIEDVSLSWNGCDDSLAWKLAEILPVCTKLKRLDLEVNKISTAGATAIAKSLPFCPSVEVIRLWKNPVAKDDDNLKDQRLNFSSV